MRQRSSIGLATFLPVGSVLPILFVALLIPARWVGGPLPGDLGGERAIQRALAGLALPDWVEIVLGLVVPAVVIAVALVRRSWRGAALLTIAVVSSDLFGGLIQLAVGRPGGGYPSVSVAEQVVFCGVLAYVVRSAYRIGRASRGLLISAVAAGVVLVAITGIAVIYQGFHWPSDVIGACFFGGAWLAFLLAGYIRLQGRKLNGTKPVSSG